MYDLKRIGQDLTELPTLDDPDRIVQDILDKTLSIVQADAGMLWEYDEGANRLACRACSGIAGEISLSLRLELGEGLVGKTYLRGTPRLYRSLEEIRRDIDDFSDENKVAMMRLFGDREINSAYLMPIFVHGRIECILIVYRAQGNEPFTAADIETLTIVSGLIEIALTNARGFLTLQAQIGSLRKCNDLYATLTHCSVDNAGIARIVDELSRALEVPVWVVDRISNEQHPRNAPFDVQRLAALAARDEGGGDGDVFAAEPEGSPTAYRVQPIVAEEDCLGYLVVEEREAATPLQRMLLEVGRMVLAVEFSKAHTRLDIAYKRMAQGFSELMSASGSLGLAAKCAELGIPTAARYAVALFAFLPGDRVGVRESSVHRVVSVLKKEMRTAPKLIFASEDRIVALLSAPSAKETGALARPIGSVLDGLADGEGMALCAGLGSPCEGAAEIGRSYQEAEKALSYQRARRSAGLLPYAELGINQVFVNLTSEEASSFLSGVLAPLSRRSENLETTLIAYIESSFSLKETARKLYIHPNTLYQRLKKIEACLGISFRNPDDLLKLQLARYLRHYYPDADGSVPSHIR